MTTTPSADVKERRRAISEWANSAAGQRALMETAASVRKACIEVDQQARVDWRLMYKPVEI